MTAKAENTKLDVKTLLVDRQAFMREVICNALALDNYRDVRALSSVEVLEEVLDGVFPDLLILDADMPDGDSVDLVRRVRLSKVGRNPFIPIILTSWHASKSLVRRAVDSGADAFVVKPFAASQLFSRIDMMITARKPFVVTADYLGPDRRETPRADGPRYFHPPNTLRNRVLGETVELSTLLLEIEAVSRQMQSIRMASLMTKITGLFDLLREGPDDGDSPEALTAKFQTMLRASISLEEDLSSTHLRHLKLPARHLASALREIERDGGPVAAHDRRRIERLLEPLRAGIECMPDEDAAEVGPTAGRSENEIGACGAAEAAVGAPRQALTDGISPSFQCDPRHSL